MPTEKKRETIAKLRELLSENTTAIATDYRGLSVAEITQLRRKLGEVGCEYYVVKDSLTLLAAKEAGREGLIPFLHGPTAIAFSHGDISQPVKVLFNHIRSANISLKVKGGITSDHIFSSEDISTLSTLPPREELLAELVGTMQAPISSLLLVLTGIMRGLVTVLEARKQQLDGG
jgi:large subunit ribosomal protein L10